MYSAPVQIVLARLDEDYTVTRHNAGTIHEHYTKVRCDRPVALVWLQSGDDTDVEKARAFAHTQGYTVFLYGTDETDPLNRARKQIQAK